MSDPAPDRSTEERVQRAVDEVLDGTPPAGRVPPPVRVDEGLAPAPIEPAVAQAEPTAPVEPWAEKLVRLLDDGLRVPGTELRFGLDGIIGMLFPSVGDMVTGAGSLSLLLLAIKHRVPTVVVARMVLNIAIDTLVGSIPVLGDAFDFFFKSNRKNLELIERYRDDPEARPGPADYLLVGGAVLMVLVSILLPILLMLLLGTGLWALVDR